MTTPLTPDPVPETTQLAVSLVDTPAGQRLALTMTMLLPAGDAKQFSQQLAAVTGLMSRAGLVIANGSGVPQ